MLVAERPPQRGISLFFRDDGVRRPLELVEHQVTTTGAILATYGRATS